VEHFSASDPGSSSFFDPVPVDPSPSYNGLVPTPAHSQPKPRHHSRHHVYALETTGLLIIAATLLAITLVRYWYAMHWSLR